MKTILVTGATGYIGAHVCKALHAKGYIVDGVDYNYNQNNIAQYCRYLFKTDIRNIQWRSHNHYDVVIHLAAKTMVSPSVADPLDYYQTNVIGTHNVIQNYSFDHFIYCSTGSAFNPTSSPYSMSKRAGEDLMVYTKQHTICRFYNVSGNNGLNKFDDGLYHLIRRCAAAVYGITDHVPLYGTDYDTEDGTTRRNYTHINDIVDSIIKIVDNGATNDIECLGSVESYSVKQVIDVVKEVSGVDFNVVVHPRRPGDIPISTLPNQSRFFEQKYSLRDQCMSAVEQVAIDLLQKK